MCQCSSGTVLQDVTLPSVMRLEGSPAELPTAAEESTAAAVASGEQHTTLYLPGQQQPALLTIPAVLCTAGRGLTLMRQILYSKLACPAEARPATFKSICVSAWVR